MDTFSEAYPFGAWAAANAALDGQSHLCDWNILDILPVPKPGTAFENSDIRDK